MDEIDLKPTQAYDLLTNEEQYYVDEYLVFAVEAQRRLRERIIHALDKPFPPEYVRKTKGLLYKPVVRAAIYEKIKEASDADDVSPDRIIKEHASIAFSTQSDFLKDSGFGQVGLKDLNDIPEEKIGAIKTIETKVNSFGMSTKIVLHDKQASLKFLSEQVGLQKAEGVPSLQEYNKRLTAEKEEDEVAFKEKYEKLLEGNKE